MSSVHTTLVSSHNLYRTGILMQRDPSRINKRQPGVDSQAEWFPGIPAPLTQKPLFFSSFCSCKLLTVSIQWFSIDSTWLFSISNGLVYTLEIKFLKAKCKKNIDSNTEAVQGRCLADTSTEWRRHPSALTRRHSTPHAVHRRLLLSKRHLKLAPLEIFPWNKRREHKLLPTCNSSLLEGLGKARPLLAPQLHHTVPLSHPHSSMCPAHSLLKDLRW